MFAGDLLIAERARQIEQSPGSKLGFKAAAGQTRAGTDAGQGRRNSQAGLELGST